MSMGEKQWILIKFKKLPKVSFTCGKINHSTICKLAAKEKTSSQFCPWLQVEPYLKGYLARSGYTNFASPPHMMETSSSSGKGTDSQNQSLARDSNLGTDGYSARWTLDPLNKEVGGGESPITQTFPSILYVSPLNHFFCLTLQRYILSHVGHV